MNLSTLKTEILSCTSCSMKDKPHVLWRGNQSAPLMIIGEAPGKVETQVDSPWTGPAGQELDKAFAAIGLDTNKHCFITNAVKARPISIKTYKENDTPTPDVIKICSDLWLKKEIEILKPKVILCMGKSAALSLSVIKSSTTMAQANGLEIWYDQQRTTKVLITYHMATILHMQNNSSEDQIIARKNEILAVLSRAKELAYG